MSRASGADGTLEKGRLTGTHVLIAILAFFGVIFAVNGYFLASALSTHTGVVSVEPYVKGVKYNERIAAGERQSRLGWQDQITATRDGTVVATLRTDADSPVSGLKLTGFVGRPTTSSLDQHLAFKEVEPGRYVASVGALADGTWVVALEATGLGHGADPIYRARRRLWLKP